MDVRPLEVDSGTLVVSLGRVTGRGAFHVVTRAAEDGSDSSHQRTRAVVFETDPRESEETQRHPERPGDSSGAPLRQAERGLTRGEVGRGSFVASGVPRPVPLRVQENTPTDHVDLSLNSPIYAEDPELGPTLAQMATRADLAEWLGDMKRAAAFLTGGVGLNLEEVAILREQLGIPADLLIRWAPEALRA